MCGIIAIVRRRSTRRPPQPAEIEAMLPPDATSLPREPEALRALADAFASVDRLLTGVAGVRALVNEPALLAMLAHRTEQYTALVADLEAVLQAEPLGDADLERANAALLALKDAIWAISHDRIRTALAVDDLRQGALGAGAFEAYTSVQEALSAIDRLEVRGRDSAGLHLLVRDHGLDLANPGVVAEINHRGADGDFRSGSVRMHDGILSFVYKAAAEIGELGDNTATIRAAIRSDDLLRRAVGNETAAAIVLGHTRWASVGIISEPNAHPVNSDVLAGEPCPYVAAALNGDVDNFADIREIENLQISPAITTDAKVIPTLLGKHLADVGPGQELVGVDEAFRRTVADLEGSVAIAASTAIAPSRLHLAVRGSGQGLFVGLTDDSYVVASEPYGVVELTSRYVRLDGETPGNPENPTASRGQIVSLDGAVAGSLEGIRRVAYDGTELPVTEDDLIRAEITTRDIDRGAYPHFLLKEIHEAPLSFRKTLRGKLVDDGDGDGLRVQLGPATLSPDIRRRLAQGTIAQVQVIGQGTAAVAGQSLALLLEEQVSIAVSALPATELSGFHLRSDMSDTLVIAISQSGTTTDTNRTVDLVRSRGAGVVAIINRRGADLSEKADGVLYTSDGRDVEMSVASTKAFYAQIAAGALLATAIADEVNGTVDDPAARSLRQPFLTSLRDLPEAMEAVIERRSQIGEAAAAFAPSRRYWAIVGNGPNIVAAREIRIKLSELCYKSIAADHTEDKKHIDLSSEPLILVCAAGLVGSTASDVAKEVAIYRAHKAAPIVIADEHSSFPAALQVLKVPSVHPSLAFVLSAMAGHLFGYEAALSIDAQARPLRETRAAIERAVASSNNMSGEVMFSVLQPTLRSCARTFLDGLRSGEYNGHLEASTASRISALYQYAVHTIPLDSYQRDYGKVGTPATVLEDLTAALTLGIEELTRPVDAIKHQAKTVTVGISRSDEELLELGVVRGLLAAGTPRDRLSYANLRTLASLDAAVEQIIGFIRYRVEGDPDSHDARLAVIDRGGVAAGLPSRVDRDPILRGSKHLVATEKAVTITQGRLDGRTIILVPEVKDGQTVGITLLHAKLHDRLPEASTRGILQGYRNRYSALRDFVTETEPNFREDLLTSVPISELLIRPVSELAELWRTP